VVPAAAAVILSVITAVISAVFSLRAAGWQAAGVKAGHSQCSRAVLLLLLFSQRADEPCFGLAAIVSIFLQGSMHTTHQAGAVK
jgi:hypothetical protein